MVLKFSRETKKESLLLYTNIVYYIFLDGCYNSTSKGLRTIKTVKLLGGYISKIVFINFFELWTITENYWDNKLKWIFAYI